MTRVIVVTGHTLFRQALAFVLSHVPELVVVGSAGSLAEARGMVDGVDVAVIDIALPDGAGTELIHLLHDASPGSAALILTACADRSDAARAVEAGAAGVLLNSATVDEVVWALRRLGAGQPLLSIQETVELLRHAIRLREEDRQAQITVSRITPREREVLQAMADGLDDESMARALHISLRTARTHIANILGKLGVDSRLQALVFAVRHGVAYIA